MAVDALILPAAFAYAALRHRSSILGFVLNRTAVIGITSALLVPVFGVLESLVERYVSERGTSKDWSREAWGRRRAGLAVSHHPREGGRRVERVRLSRTARGRSRATELHARRGILHQEDGGDRRGAGSNQGTRSREGCHLVCGLGRPLRGRRQHADASASRFLDADDPVAVALARRRASGRLPDFKTALAGERAYPLTLAGKLQGFLVVGARVNEEQMPPDIDAAVQRVAEAVGKSLESVEKERLRQEVAEARAEAARSRRDAERPGARSRCFGAPRGNDVDASVRRGRRRTSVPDRRETSPGPSD